MLRIEVSSAVPFEGQFFTRSCSRRPTMFGPSRHARANAKHQSFLTGTVGFAAVVGYMSATIWQASRIRGRDIATRLLNEQSRQAGLEDNGASARIGEESWKLAAPAPPENFLGTNPALSMLLLMLVVAGLMAGMWLLWRYSYWFRETSEKWLGLTEVTDNTDPVQYVTGEKEESFPIGAAFGRIASIAFAFLGGLWFGHYHFGARAFSGTTAEHDFLSQHPVLLSFTLETAGAFLLLAGLWVLWSSRASFLSTLPQMQTSDSVRTADNADASIAQYLPAVNAPSGETAPTGDVPEPDGRPWSPLFIGACTFLCCLMIGPAGLVWGGVMTALNWHRLDAPKKWLRPVLVSLTAGFLAWMAIDRSTTTASLAWYGLGVLLLLSALGLIVWLDLIPQYRAYRSHRATGGARASVAIPVLAAVGLAGIGAWYFYASGVEENVYYDLALEATQNGNDVLAIQYYTKAIEKNPTDPIFWGDRGLCKHMLGNNDEALEDLAKAIRLGDPRASIVALRGLIFANRGDTILAIADSNQAIEMDSTCSLAFCVRSQAYLAEGNAVQAIADVHEALRLDPTNADAYAVRGSIYQHNGEIEKAEADFAAARQLQEGPQ